MLSLIIASIIDTGGFPKPAADDSAIQNGLQVIFAITGSVALLVITIAGFRYVVSHGDPNQITQAKNAILYAVIGLVISLTAFSIVTFVVGGIQ